MITISTPTFDPDGSITLQELVSSDLGSLSRRVTRIATLDGGAVMPDYGYSDADRTLKVVAKINAVQLAAVRRLVRLYPVLVLACSDGLFRGAIADITTKKNELTITFLVRETI